MRITVQIEIPFCARASIVPQSGGGGCTPNSIVYGSLLALVLAAKFLLSDWDNVVSLSLDIIYQHVTVSPTGTLLLATIIVTCCEKILEQIMFFIMSNL